MPLFVPHTNVESIFERPSTYECSGHARTFKSKQPLVYTKNRLIYHVFTMFSLQHVQHMNAIDMLSHRQTHTPSLSRVEQKGGQRSATELGQRQHPLPSTTMYNRLVWIDLVIAWSHLRCVPRFNINHLHFLMSLAFAPPHFWSYVSTLFARSHC